jgi:hypothetical protein
VVWIPIQPPSSGMLNFFYSYFMLTVFPTDVTTSEQTQDPSCASIVPYQVNNVGQIAVFKTNMKIALTVWSFLITTTACFIKLETEKSSCTSSCTHRNRLEEP